MQDDRMMKAIDVIVELQRRYAADWDRQAPSQEDMASWAGGSDNAEALLYDDLGAELARGYHAKRYSFHFCDAVVNQLSALMLGKQTRERPPPWPKLFWRVYEAFDAGELATHRVLDPVATYTDPVITRIVGEL